MVERRTIMAGRLIIPDETMTVLHHHRAIFIE